MQLQSPNFSFLAKHDPLLLRCAALAERYVFEDPDTALIKLRQLIEGLANYTATYVGMYADTEASLVDLITEFRLKGIITPEVADIWHTIRKDGNAAAHGNKQFTQANALTSLRLSRKLAVWFHQAFGKDATFRPGPFVPPQAPKDASSELQEQLNALQAEMHQKLAELEAAKLVAKDFERKANEAYAELDVALSLAEETEAKLGKERQEFTERLTQLQVQTEAKSDEQIAEVIRDAAEAAEQFDLSEAETRAIIDQQLHAAGWQADTQKLDYRRGARPQKGKFLAIAEWPTDSGRADYVLFDGLLPVAVVEAKRKNKNVASFISTQATRYSKGFHFDGGALKYERTWGEFQIPFLFSSNGKPFLEQIKEESGIWFRDARRGSNLPHPLSGWPSPEGLKKKLKYDQDEADAALKSEPIDLLDLRPYQKQAVTAVEEALLTGKRSILLAMATGTGKTRVCVSLLYRLIKAKKFARALFLVDRTSLGQQALDENFKYMKLDGGKPFTDIYEVKALGDIYPETDTKLHIATIQGMMKRVLYPSDDAPPPVDTYDLIVVDECHRGYILDRDMSDAELNFRGEEDYVSKYRRVLDYFDAARVGVTATPALHTKQIFGEPVFFYSYRDAVIDDVLVDHLPPYRIITKLAKDGITWQAGATVEIYQPKTGQLTLFDTPDDIKVEVDQFNKRVITESFNKTICAELAKEIDPTAPGKTLVFCVDDRHADMVVRLLKDAFSEQYGEVDDEAVVKITGEPNTDKPLELLKKYKNEFYPSVAVTVDYLTTGIDVRPIVNLVFIRKVRSRILYEQMLGRATRKCDDLYSPGEHKDAFRIFDAVDIYATLEDLNTMRPVVNQPNISFQKLISELDRVQSPEHRQEVFEQIIVKLNRALKRLSAEKLHELETLTGVSIAQLAAHVRGLTLEEGKDFFTTRTAELLDSRSESNFLPLLISHEPDDLLAVERGYGEYQKPEDYLSAFASYIRNNANQIAALTIVTTRPSALTRKDLRALRVALDQAGFPEKTTEAAFRATNQQCAASIIGFIRRAALGSPLVPYEQRLSRAMEKIYNLKSWSEPQRNWLKRFEKQLKQEVILDVEALNTGQFQTNGGFPRINKIFNGEAEHLLREIQEEIWRDVG